VAPGREGLARLVARRVRDIPDFPTPGVLFKDISPLLADPTAFAAVTEHFAGIARASGADLVVGIEARGFILAAPAAVAAGIGFVPLRKPGKLPGVTLRESYALEYGEASLEMHEDALEPGARILVMDDVLATGGTAQAAAGLVERTGASVVQMAFLLELADLEGRAAVGPRPMDVLLTV
jgi:adenine phosphoribosyltransferase